MHLRIISLEYIAAVIDLEINHKLGLAVTNSSNEESLNDALEFRRAFGAK